MKPVTWEPKKGKLFFTEYWEVEFKDHQLNGLEATCRKKWENRNEWEIFLVAEVLKKLRFKFTGAEFDLNKLETSETVLGVAQKIKEIWEWALKEPPQKVLVKKK
jgi:hypothetical protein